MFLAPIFNGVIIYTYFCPTGGTKLGATDIINVSTQVIEEATEAGCCGDGVTYGEGLLGVWDTTDVSSFV